MRRLIASLLTGAAVFGAVSPALAAPPPWSNGRGNDRYEDRRHDDRRYDDRRDNRRDDRRWDNRKYRWSNDHQWRRGDRFDTRTRYVVIRDRDYRNYRLPPPRRGEYYARTDAGDILLVAAATGLVLWALNQ